MRKRTFLGASLGFGAAAHPLLAEGIDRAQPGGRGNGGRGEILWDTYGVPHIYANDETGVFYGFGWSQAHNHANIILRLYGEARGRAAEYWGHAFERSDRWILANGIPLRAAQWFKASSPLFQRNLSAFADGINDFARANLNAIDPAAAAVLPVTGIDVMAHAHRLMNYIYIAPEEKTTAEVEPPGSNAWAVAPSKSASGNTMLLANPHLPWATSYFTYFEADLNGPGIKMYGATQVGLPVLRFCFNERMGFTNTVNTLLGSTNYELTPSGEGYLFDGRTLAFSVKDHEYQVKQPDGSLKTISFSVRSSIHGPVFQRPDGKLVALRVAGLDRPGGLQQYWDMGKSNNFAEFQAILKRLQVSKFNIIYGDKSGHIQYMDNGILPKHPSGNVEYWDGLVPGDTSATLWSDIHSYDELPKLIDPPTGWVQNTNDPPWIATYPQSLYAKDYPAYVAPQGPESLRSQQSAHLLFDAGKLSYDQFVAKKLSTHTLMADRVLPDLLAACEGYPDPEVQAAVELLRGWDRETVAESRAALLFETWATKFSPKNFSVQSNYKVKWTASAPIDTPNGIADPPAAVRMLKEAIADMKEKYGAIDRPFGEVSRFHIDNVDLPGNGGFGNTGIFRTITWGPLKNGERNPIHGETWVSIVEFSTPLKAKGLMSYGNASQPGSPHRADQLKHLSEKTLRTLWTTREEVERNLEKSTPI